MKLNHKQHQTIINLILGILVIIVIMWITNIFKPHNRNITAYSVATRGIQYCHSSNPQQTLDLFKPKHHKGDQALPIIVYIHGGGWSGGTKNDPLIMNVWGPNFIKKGYAVATIGYRLKAPSLYQDQNDDIACALAYLTKHSSSLGINMDEAIFFGASAGGQLAAYAALSAPYKDYQYQAPLGVVDFYGVSSFPSIVRGDHPDYNARRYLGKNYLNLAAEASPVNLVKAGAPPFLLVHGTADTVVPPTQSQELYQALRRAGVAVEYIQVPNAHHAFNGPELGRKEYNKVKIAVNSFIKDVLLEHALAQEGRN